MSLSPVTPIDAFPVTLEEVKAHLRVDGDDENLLISALIAAAVEHIDGRDGWLGRAILTQEWELRLDGFPKEIQVPLPPLQAVSSIKYIDTEGVEQTLDPSVYKVLTGETAKVVLDYNQSWPWTRDELESVRIQFTAGYGGATDVPSPIKAAILLHIGTLYRDREATGQAQSELPMAYGALLAPYRVWSA